MEKTNYNKAKFWQVLAFAGNDSATNAGYILITTFFVLMLTDSLLLSGVIAGLILTLARIFDGITDPIIGTLIDKTVTKFGKFRPFILLGSLIINIGILAIFGGFVIFENAILMYIWIIAWYLIYVIGYTLQTACTKSAQVQLTNDPKQRPLFGLLNTLITLIYITIFLAFSVSYVYAFRDSSGVISQVPFRTLAYVAVFANIFFTFFSLLGISGKDKPGDYAEYKQRDKINVAVVWDVIKNNNALKALIAAAATNKLAQTLYTAALVYFYTYTVRNIALQQTVALFGLPATLIGAVAGATIARRAGNKKSFLVGTWLAIAFGLIIFFVQPFNPGQETLFFVLMTLIGTSGAIATMNIMPLIADVSDYEYWKNDRFIPGIVGTTFSLVDKLVSSASGLILGLTLGIIAYKPDMAWSPRLYWAFLIVMIIVPVLGHVASVIAFKWYPINKSKYEQMHMEINIRKSQQNHTEEVAE